MEEVVSKGLKLIIITSYVNRFKAIANFLLRRGCSTLIMSDFKQALVEASKAKPDFILISWNLKDTAPARVLDLFQKKLGVPCIAFAEESDSKTAAGISTSGAIDFIHAPISGPVFFMRIQKAIKTIEEKVSESKAAQDSADTTVAAVEIAKARGVWVEKASNKKGQKLWMFKREDTGSGGKTYFYRGESPPIQNKVGYWEKTNAGDFIFEEDLLAEKDPEWIAALSSEEVRTKTKTNAQESLKFLLETILKSDNTKAEPNQSPDTSYSVIEVKGHKNSGFVTVLFSNNKKENPQQCIEVLQDELEVSLRESQANMWTELSFWINAKDISKIETWLSQEGEFVVTGQVRDQQVTVFYIDRKRDRPTIGETKIQEMISVPMSLIKADEPIDFDAFIWLEKNSRFLRYFKKGSIVYNNQIENLRKFNTTELFVSERDKAAVCIYESKTYLRERFEKFDDARSL